jgi:hypothetical protein
MTGKSIDKNFKPRFSGILQFVANYEEFKDLSEGDSLAILAQDKEGFGLGAYLESVEILRNKQRVFLQHQKKEEFTNKSKIIVSEFLFPLSGKIYLNDFKQNKIKEYPVK